MRIISVSRSHISLFVIVLSLAFAPASQALSASSDPVAQLQAKLDSGAASLEFDADHGYLKSLLQALNIPVDSQGLVFSKTSLQASLISPQTPRALYFNDDVYVGWVPGTKALEIASVDPKNGPVFYLLPQKS